MAKDVIETKIPVTLESMTAFERKTIHQVLSNNDEISTYSEGEEPNRCIVIKIKEG
jgi:spoIIIJ-associated protein